MESIQFRRLTEFGTEEERERLPNTNEFSWGDCAYSLVFADDLRRETADMGLVKLTEDLQSVPAKLLILLDSDPVVF